MSSQLLEIEPQELKFIFELKKQSSCSVRLLNKSNHHVAFKIKTTSPKKYSVRPNIGIIEPKSARAFVVTMQAPRVIPPDLLCKDKFLIQSTVVPMETNEDEITSSMFVKDDGGYVEERKLKVILASPPHSPELSPINRVHSEAPVYDTSMLKDHPLQRVETVSPKPHVTESIESKLEDGEQLVAAMPLNHETEKDEDKLELTNEIEKLKSKISELETVKDVQELEMVTDTKTMKAKISELELKLQEAEVNISKLIEERRLAIQDRESLQRELALLRTKKGTKQVRAGFPFLFVCMVALISIVVGYLLRC